MLVESKMHRYSNRVEKISILMDRSKALRR
jgi:hypothetical protein